MITRTPSHPPSTADNISLANRSPLTVNEDKKRKSPKIEFTEVERPSKYRRALVTAYRNLTGASTGSLSSGFGIDSITISNDDISNASEYPGPATSTDCTEKEDSDIVDIVVEDSDFSVPIEKGDSCEVVSEPQHNQSHGEMNSSVPSRTSFIPRIRWNMNHFFFTKFDNDDQENLFQKERWSSAKKPMLFLSVFFILNWLLYLSINASLKTFDMQSTYSKLTYVRLNLYKSYPTHHDQSMD